jgi:hypothetical protein
MLLLTQVDQGDPYKLESLVNQAFNFLIVTTQSHIGKMRRSPHRVGGV